MTILGHTRKTPRRRSRQHGIAVFAKAGEVSAREFTDWAKSSRVAIVGSSPTGLLDYKALRWVPQSFARFWRRVGEASRCTLNWKRKARPLRPAHRSV